MSAETQTQPLRSADRICTPMLCRCHVQQKPASEFEAVIPFHTQSPHFPLLCWNSDARTRGGVFAQPEEATAVSRPLHFSPEQGGREGLIHIQVFRCVADIPCAFRILQHPKDDVPASSQASYDREHAMIKTISGSRGLAEIPAAITSAGQKQFVSVFLCVPQKFSPSTVN